MTTSEAIDALVNVDFAVERVIRGGEQPREQLHIECNVCGKKWSLQNAAIRRDQPEFAAGNILALVDHAKSHTDKKAQDQKGGSS